jgi:hypothetical protein
MFSESSIADCHALAAAMHTHKYHCHAHAGTLLPCSHRHSMLARMFDGCMYLPAVLAFEGRLNRASCLVVSRFVTPLVGAILLLSTCHAGH